MDCPLAHKWSKENGRWLVFRVATGVVTLWSLTRKPCDGTPYNRFVLSDT